MSRLSHQHEHSLLHARGLGSVNTYLITRPVGYYSTSTLCLWNLQILADPDGKTILTPQYEPVQ